jgi:hypothetical protein
VASCPNCQSELDDADASVCNACGHLVGLPFKSVAAMSFMDTDDPGPVSVTGSRKEDFGGDAVILGDVDGEFTSFHGESQGPQPVPDPNDFLTAATDESGIVRTVVPAPMFVDDATAALIASDAVIALAPGADLSAISPFEQHVSSFINGRRPVARIGVKSELSDDDLRIALGMLADRGLLRLIGHMKPGVDVEAEPEPALAQAPEPLGPADAAALGIELVPIEPDPAPEPVPSTSPSVPVLPATEVDQDGPAISVIPAIPGSEAPQPTRGAIRSEARRAEVAPEPTLRPSPRPEPAPIAALGDDLTSLPKDVRLYRQALQREQSGRYDEAVRLLRHALQVNPNGAAIHNLLGVLLATRRKDFGGAIEALMKACELEPVNAAYKRNLEKVMEKNIAAGKGGKKKGRGFLKKKLF